jgi:serum/glucocorticoid-regulated kinase 2
MVTRADFKDHHAIGRGGFGKVIKVEKDGKFYAMKEMLKARVMAKKSVDSVKRELELMQMIDSDFVVNVQWAFIDTQNLYLVMDLMEGGDLRYLMIHRRRFPEEQTKFFLACLIQALEHVHEERIIHRDIKPENLVFEANGYLRLTDFGIA